MALKLAECNNARLQRFIGRIDLHKTFARYRHLTNVYRSANEIYVLLL